MKWSFASVGLIVLGLIGVAVIILFQQITTNNENDYYLLKEVTEAAMIDSIDIPYYRETGNLKIVKEKFVENFTRRFAESTIFVTSTYDINFYDIIETPPKVSIVVNTGLGEYTINGNSDEYGIANKLDAILEYSGKYENAYVTKDDYYDYYYFRLSSNGSFDEKYSLKMPAELNQPNIKDVVIKNIDYNGIVDSQIELNEALLKEQINFNKLTVDDMEYMQFIKDFSKNVANVGISYYNCNSRKGTFNNMYNCNDNDYWVNISGINNDSSKNNVILKYKITWSYKIYEF